ncbi:ferredoxin-type protein NapF [Neiella holothuriorum]
MAADPARRALLRGRVAKTLIIRPPWAVAEADFTDSCSRCGDCVEVCPTNIIVKGSGGFPEIDFSKGAGECELCERCVVACTDNALSLNEQPWQWQLTLNDGACLAHQGVACRSCGEYCPTRAIQFKPQIGGHFVPSLNTEICNGCGACISPCPTNALEAKQVG